MRFLIHVISSSFIVILLSGGVLQAATCTTQQNGTWDCGETPDVNDDLVVKHDITINGSFTSTGSITINNGTLTIDGNLTMVDYSLLIINANGALMVNSDTKTEDNTSVDLFGTLTGSGNIEMKDASNFSVHDGGSIDALRDFKLNGNSDGTTLRVFGGGFADVTGKFEIRSDDLAVIDGTVTVGDDFKNDGTMYGTGTLSYAGNCDGNGTVCGGSAFCGGSGMLPLSCFVLPVELIGFEAIFQEGSVYISWLTAAETNSASFTVERSANGIDFIELTTIASTGNNSQEAFYSYSDLNPQVGISYYRLKQTDLDGTTKYLALEVVNNQVSLAEFYCFPNPSVGSHLQFNGNFSVEIYNQLGEVILKKENIDKLDISDLSPGLFYIRNQNGKTTSLVVN